METDKRKLEDVYRDIAKWEVAEETGELESREPTSSTETERLEAYLKRALQ